VYISGVPGYLLTGVGRHIYPGGIPLGGMEGIYTPVLASFGDLGGIYTPALASFGVWEEY